MERSTSRIRHDTTDIVRGLLQRARLKYLERHHDKRYVKAGFTFVNSGVSIGLLAVVAHFAQSPFIFPSLGTTAFLVFYRPMASSASPRNAICGHGLAAMVGWLSLFLFGMTDATSALQGGITWPFVGAAALSLAGTNGLLVLLDISHPPAAATTLIVALGLMSHLWQIPVLVAGVTLLVAQAFALNRLAGVPYPVWKPAGREVAE